MAYANASSITSEACTIHAQILFLLPQAALHPGFPTSKRKPISAPASRSLHTFQTDPAAISKVDSTLTLALVIELIRGGKSPEESQTSRKWSKRCDRKLALMSATPEVQGKPAVSESALKEAPAINSTGPMPLQFRDDVRETNAEDGGKILIF